MAIVAEGGRSRVYLEPTAEHEAVAKTDRPSLPEVAHGLPNDPRNFWTLEYGLDSFESLFTARQLLALKCFSDLIAEAREQAYGDATKFLPCGNRHHEVSLAEGGLGAKAYSEVVATYLSFALSKLADRGSSICTWFHQRDSTRPTFARQSIPMSWDFAELNTLMKGTGSFLGAAMWTAESLEAVPAAGGVGTGFSISAPKNNFPVRPSVISTDPPYYDNIGYSDLSDFFYVWLRSSLREVFPDLFRRVLTPKTEELVATPYRHGGREGAEHHFMSGMADALSAMKDASGNRPLAIYYAFKQSETREAGILSPGWAAFLSAVIRSGLCVDGTWPVRSELSNRMIASGTNALASSVVLVCRKREENAHIVPRRDFLRELKITMRDAIESQAEVIPLPDRRQAAIGPGIGVFSKYRAVREPDDSEMTVATALTLINREVDAILAEGTEALDLETRFALEWYGQHAFAEVKGGAGQAIAQLNGFNLSEAAINRSGIGRIRGGDAKLLTREEMAAAHRERHGKDWHPHDDDTPTAWEMAQHLARVLNAEDGGIDAAGRLLAAKPDAASDVLLVAERLFDMESRRNPQEALVWNELQQAFPEIRDAAERQEGVRPIPIQDELQL